MLNIIGAENAFDRDENTLCLNSSGFWYESAYTAYNIIHTELLILNLFHDIPWKYWIR